MLAPQPPQQIGNIVALLPPVAGDGGEDTQGLRDALVEEVKAEYHVSLKKSIGTESSIAGPRVGLMHCRPSSYPRKCLLKCDLSTLKGVSVLI